VKRPPFAYTAIFLAAALLPVILPARERPADKAAKEAFARVEEERVPTAPDLYRCTVTQYDVIRKGNSERAVALPRDAYCRFLLALIQSDASGLKEAPAKLEKAGGNEKNNMAPLLNILATLARWEAGEPELPEAVQKLPLVNCSHAEFVSERTCGAILNAGYIWAGWFELHNNRLARASEILGHAAASPWQQWSLGLARMNSDDWQGAVAAFNETAKAWSGHTGPANLTELLSPKPELSQVYAKLGYSQFMSKQLDAAIGNLDRALFAKPDDAPSLFLRGRVREELGLPKPALIDFEAAAKTGSFPLAAAVVLLREGKSTEAAKAFADLPASTPNLDGWKLLATGCSAPLDKLTQASETASPVFPKREAAALALDCRLKAVVTLADLVALEPELKRSSDAEVHEGVSNAYLKLGLAAEDRQNNAEAIAAYLHSLEWSPANTKARFNLAALYIGDQKFDQAESEYRALLASDPNDYEAQFWLAQSILVAKPDAGRKAEACGLLQRAMNVPDAARRAEITAAVAGACAPDRQ
jgi:tetratricopeptide (TPR) repeat protein